MQRIHVRLLSYCLSTTKNSFTFPSIFKTTCRPSHLSLLAVRSRPVVINSLTRNLSSGSQKVSLFVPSPIVKRMASNGVIANGNVKEKKPFSRLPSNIQPLHYEVFLKPDLKSLTFQGQMSVKVNVIQSTDTLVCNAADLTVLGVHVNDKVVDDIILSKDEETMTVRLPSPLPAQSQATLVCKFNGELNDMMRGFYRSKYMEKGEERYGAVTQFEATDARRCFPCWDEPAIKATFDMTISAPKDRVVLSNMPVKNETDDQETSGYKVVQFETSPKMSTYLVAIVVGEYEYVEDNQ